MFFFVLLNYWTISRPMHSKFFLGLLITLFLCEKNTIPRRFLKCKNFIMPIFFFLVLLGINSLPSSEREKLRKKNVRQHIPYYDYGTLPVSKQFNIEILLSTVVLENVKIMQINWKNLVAFVLFIKNELPDKIFSIFEEKNRLTTDMKFRLNPTSNQRM